MTGKQEHNNYNNNNNNGDNSLVLTEIIFWVPKSFSCIYFSFATAELGSRERRVRSVARTI